MIKLFNINDYIVNTSNFTNKINDVCVLDFEKKFAKFVGAKYACGFSSATNAIFLTFIDKQAHVQVPSMIPTVVLNALIHGNNKFSFVDNVDWVGDSYVLHQFKDYKVIDSAQKVEKNQFKKEANDEDLMIFSFYPTKPVGSIDGGIIVSNDLEKIKWFRKAVMNGTGIEENSWDRKIYFPGWKMYLNSFQAYIANENFKLLEEKQEKLKKVRDKYNNAFCIENTSNHLYRIDVKNREKFIKIMKEKNITTGIHYQPAHKIEVYKSISKNNKNLLKTERKGETTVSIPFHECLTEKETDFIIDSCFNTGLILKE